MPPVQIKNPALIQGVSRQPDSQRAPGTCFEAINGYFDESEGFRKRNGIQFIAALNANDADEQFSIHWLRTGNKEFVCLIQQDVTEPIQVFNLADGTKKTVNYDSSSPMQTYLNSGSGDNRWRVLSVFDSTFILNRSVTVAVSGTSPGWTPSANPDGGFFRLPQIPPNTTNVYQLIESTTNRPAGFWRGNTSSAGVPDPWDRLEANADNNHLTDTTMPLNMVYDSSADDFNVSYPDWAERQSGSQITNPAPSFVGRTLDDIVFHRNRLWLMADQAVVASAAGDYFKFWRDDVFNLTDSDQIDQFVTDEGLNKIVSGVTFNQAMVIFTQGARQFQVRSAGALSPSSINIIPTTNYDISRSVRPVRLGSQLYFFGRHSNYGQMFEYYYNDSAANNIATDVSSHVKKYIEDQISVMSGEVNNGLVVAHKYNTDTLFTYKMAWNGRQKFQSAWGKWKLRDNGYKVLSSQIFGDNLYLLMRFGETPKLILGKINIVKANKYTGIPYNIHLDFYQHFATGTYDSANNRTYWDLSYGTGGAGVVVIPTTGNVKGIAVAATIQDQTEHQTRVFVEGNYATTQVQIGIPFDYSITLNQPYLYDQSNAVVSGTFSLKQISIYVKDTVQFTLRQQIDGIQKDNLQYYTAAKVDGTNVQYNTVPISQHDRVDLAIMGRGQTLNLTIEDRSEFPCTIVGTEHRGDFTARTNQE